MSATGLEVATGRKGRDASGNGGRGDRRRRWSPGPWTREAVALTLVIAVLVLLGLVMTFSASFVEAAQDGDPFGVFRRQLMWAGIGVVAFIVLSAVDHRIVRRFAWIMFIGSLAGLVLVLTPVGIERSGATRWIAFGPVALQPSEFAKLGLLVWVADVLERKRPKDGSVLSTDHLLIPAVPAFLVMAVLVMLQPDLGTTVLLGLILAAVLWVEGLRLRYVLGLLVLAAGGVLLAAFGAVYRSARITGWLNPEADPGGAGFQLLQSKYAMADGGLFGLGLGASRGKWNRIPNPETDFIFAIIGEELGFVGAMTVVLLFFALLYLGLKVAYGTQDLFGRTVAAAVTTWIVGQAFVNIGTVIGLLPITGVPLPLLSVGGTSLLSTLIALGMLVAIARQPARLPRRTTPPRTLRAVPTSRAKEQR